MPGRAAMWTKAVADAPLRLSQTCSNPATSCACPQGRGRLGAFANPRRAGRIDRTRSGRRRDPRAGWWLQLSTQQIQSRRADLTSARIQLQAIPLLRRFRTRLQSRIDRQRCAGDISPIHRSRTESGLPRTTTTNMTARSGCARPWSIRVNTGLGTPARRDRHALRTQLYPCPLRVQPEPDYRTTCRWRLGTASVAPLNMARAYAVFANGGFLIDPYFIRDITDRDGKISYQANPALALVATTAVDASAAGATRRAGRSSYHRADPMPRPTAQRCAEADSKSRAAHDRSANDYLITSMMRDVIRRGTGSAAMVLKRNDLAGKTGTTNDHRDAWFSGFNSKLVATSMGRI